jgi:methyltransferase family protein
MHAEAYGWVAGLAPKSKPGVVLDIGGRNINGSVRDLFPEAESYTALDIAPGDGVDIVADAADWAPDREYDTVVCTEVFEHTPRWPEICRTAFAALRSGGLFITTMAGPGRPAHSAVDGGGLRLGEYYGNVDPYGLGKVLAECGFVDVTVDVQISPNDVRAIAGRP